MLAFNLVGKGVVNYLGSLNGDKVDIKTIIINGLIGGVAGGGSAWFGAWLHKHYTKSVPEERREFTYDIEQHRIIHVKETFEITFHECTTALKLIKKIKTKKIDKINGVLIASVGMTFRSSGEKIKISIKKKSINSLKIYVESKPKLWGARIDFGKNFENIEIIVAHIVSVLTTENVRIKK